MFNFEVEILPPVEFLIQDFAELGLDIRSFREPLKRSVQGVVAPSIQLNFDVEGRPPWAPLAESTVDEKQRLGYPPDILTRTGKLRRVAGQLNAWTITQEDATMTNLPGAEYGEFHQDGTRFMPVREFAIIQDPEDVDEIQQVFEHWLVERFVRKGLIPVGI
jgi:phage gpG-like protein